MMVAADMVGYLIYKQVADDSLTRRTLREDI